MSQTLTAAPAATFTVQYRLAGKRRWLNLTTLPTLLAAAEYASDVLAVDHGAIVATRYLDVDGTVMGGCGRGWRR